MTILEQKHNVAVKINEKGVCTDIAKVKLVSNSEYKALLKESNQHKELLESEKLKEKEEQEKLIVEIGLTKMKQNYFIAKSYFDNLVDRGICDTNDEFERMFDTLVKEGIELDLNSGHIPPLFRLVLKRLGE